VRVNKALRGHVPNGLASPQKVVTLHVEQTLTSDGKARRPGQLKEDTVVPEGSFNAE
jgi:hypothetical protein